MEIIKSYDSLSADIRNRLIEANVFFSKEYSDYMILTGSCIWYAMNDILIMPINISKRAMIRHALYVSEPFGLRQKIDNGALVAFLNDTSLMLKKEGISWINTSAAALFNVYPDDSIRIPFGSHIVDLKQTEDELLRGMHSKHRNSVRRAEKNGVTIIKGGKELITDYLKADKDTWKRSGKGSYGAAFFDKIVDGLFDKAVIYVAYKDDKPQSGACYFYNKKMCYYMYGASITNPEPGSANLLQWKAMLDMKEEGVEHFSFVGCRINEDEDSKYHGIQRFKERFGGQLWQGYMFKCVLNPWRYRAFCVLYAIKNRHKLTDAIDQEKSKWMELQDEQCIR